LVLELAHSSKENGKNILYSDLALSQKEERRKKKNGIFLDV
jgi:hypothetical protein